MKEIIGIILSALGATLSLLVVARTALETFTKYRAKRQLIYSLQADEEFIRFFATHQNRLEEIQKRIKYLKDKNEDLDLEKQMPELKALTDMRAIIRKHVDHLRVSDQRKIEEGFDQPSARGRINYLKDICESTVRGELVH